MKRRTETGAGTGIETEVGLMGQTGETTLGELRMRNGCYTYLLRTLEDILIM